MYYHEEIVRILSSQILPILPRSIRIEMEAMFRELLPDDTKALEAEVEELRVQLQQADQLDKARYAEIVKQLACIVRLEAEHTISHAAVERLRDVCSNYEVEHNEAQSKIKEQKAYIVTQRAHIVSVQVQRSEALSKIKDLEKQISEFLYADYSNYSCLAKDTSKTITDLHVRIEKLQIRLSNCAHYAQRSIERDFFNSHFELQLIATEAHDAR